MTRNTTHTDRCTRRRFLATSATVSAVAVAGASPATAQTTEETPEGFFADENLGSQVYMSAAFLRGMFDGAVQQYLESPSPDIDDHVSAAVDEFEAHSDDWLAYVNTRRLGGADRQSLRLIFEYGGNERDRFVVADWTGDEYASVDVRTAYDGDPDFTTTLRDRAVTNAADELETLHEEYIKPDKDIPKSYASKLAGRYFVGSENQHVSASLLGGG